MALYMGPNPGTGVYQMFTFAQGTADNTTNMQFYYPLLMTVRAYWHTKCRKKAGILLYCMVPYPNAPVRCHGCGKVVAKRKVKTALNKGGSNEN